MRTIEKGCDALKPCWCYHQLWIIYPVCAID
jgi:hypothetical protein